MRVVGVLVVATNMKLLGEMRDDGNAEGMSAGGVIPRNSMGLLPGSTLAVPSVILSPIIFWDSKIMGARGAGFHSGAPHFAR